LTQLLTKHVIAKLTRISVGIVVLILVSTALAWPLISALNVPFIADASLAINDLKSLREGDPLQLNGTVTFVDRDAGTFYFQDKFSGIRIALDGALPTPGQRISLRAEIGSEYDETIGLRSVRLTNVRVIKQRSGSLPQAESIAIRDLLRGSQKHEGRRLKISGVVRAARLQGERLSLQLGDSGQRMSATVLGAGNIDPSSLIDARINVSGTLQLALDRVAESFAPHLWVVAPEHIVIESRPSQAPKLVTSGRQLFIEPNWVAHGHRVRLRGAIVRMGPDDTLLMDSGGLLIPVQADAAQSFAPGDYIEATGWPTRSRWNMVLERAEISRIDAPATRVDHADPAALMDVRHIRALSSADAGKNLPVDVTAVVTSINPLYQFLFVQAGDVGIFIDAWGQSLEGLEPGHRVHITGLTAPGEFAPVIAQPWLRVLGDSPLPNPRTVEPERAPSGGYDSQWVELQGLVRPFSSKDGYVEFNLETEIGSVGAILITSVDLAKLAPLVDARIRARGVLGTSFTTNGVLTGYRLFVHSIDHLQVIKPALISIEADAPRSIDQLLRFKGGADSSRRVTVHGLVTMRSRGRTYIEDSTGSLQIQAVNDNVHVGDRVKAIGYPNPSSDGPILSDASIHPLGGREDLQPLVTDPEKVLSGNLDNRLVSIEARLVSRGESAAQQTWVLQSGYHVFNAELEGSIPLPSLREGSIVRVVGICAVQRRHRTDRFRGNFDSVPDSFRVLLRSVDDIALVRAAPWWSVGHAWPVIGLLTLSICLAMLWARVLRRRVEAQTAEIEDQSAFLRQVIDMCPDRISVKDRDGHYTLANRALAQEYGQSPEYLIGKNDRELGADDISAEEARELEREVLDSKLEKTIAEHVRKDRSGRILWFHTVKRPVLNKAGEPTHVLDVSNDITPHKEAEKILQGARGVAEAANRAKSEFLANMSHEIRTPLNGIIGMSELCLDTELTSEQREYVQALKLSGDGLLGVINDILDFSKIEAGKLELEARSLDLRDTLGAVLKTLALEAHRKGVELLCEIAPNVPVTVLGDANRLRQVFLNLIGDCVRATERGEVCVSVALQSCDDSECTLSFSIADSSMRTATRDFSAMKLPEHGGASSTGQSAELGLTISTRLVTLMKGQIWQESGADSAGGRRIQFTIRLGTILGQPQSSPQVGRLLLRGVRVLIVDDNATHRRILERSLQRAGLRPVCAGSASEALEHLQDCASTNDPCLLALVDFDMPIMDGASLVERIRERCMSLAVVMMLSSVSQRQGLARCRALNVDAQIVKPFYAEDLQSEIARVLEERESHRPTKTDETSTPVAGEGLNVLVAEDNTVNQMVMQRLLNKRGHRVTIAGSGKAALQALETQAFDLILMDVQMPEVDGLEATREIRRRETPSNRTPIVALTAHAMSGDRERCLAAGMDGYMTKPVSPRELEEVLEKYGARGSGLAACGLRGASERQT
jgi:PAS domain S-box-containing protein